jgi:PAS domain-containing protein
MRIMKINLAAEKILEIKGEMIVGRYHTEVLNKPITDLLNNRKVIERGEISYIHHQERKYGWDLHSLL